MSYCICVKSFGKRGPIDRLIHAEELLIQSYGTCENHYASHQEACVEKALILLSLGTSQISDGLMKLGVTLRDNVSPVLVAGLPSPWGADPPGFEWMQKALAEIVGDKDGTTQVLEDVMQEIAEEVTS